MSCSPSHASREWHFSASLRGKDCISECDIHRKRTVQAVFDIVVMLIYRYCWTYECFRPWWELGCLWYCSGISEPITTFNCSVLLCSALLWSIVPNSLPYTITYHYEKVLLPFVYLFCRLYERKFNESSKNEWHTYKGAVPSTMWFNSICTQIFLIHVDEPWFTSQTSIICFVLTDTSVLSPSENICTAIEFLT